MPRILPPLVLFVALAACSEPAGPPSAPADAIAVDVRGVGIDQRSSSPVLLLEEADGERVLPIWIGPFEAGSIQAVIDSREPPRPNTHDLAKRLLEDLGATIEYVTVTELRGNIFYAVVRVLANREAREIDARPSDAIAMALLFDAPVYVSSSLFDEHGGRTDDASSDPVASSGRGAPTRPPPLSRGNR